MKSVAMAAVLMVVLPLSACGGGGEPAGDQGDLEDRLAYSFVQRDGTTEKQSECLAGALMDSGLSNERLESFAKESDAGSELTAKENSIVSKLGPELAKCE